MDALEGCQIELKMSPDIKFIYQLWSNLTFSLLWLLIKLLNEEALTSFSEPVCYKLNCNGKIFNFPMFATPNYYRDWYKVLIDFGRSLQMNSVQVTVNMNMTTSSIDYISGYVYNRKNYIGYCYFRVRI